MPTLMGYDSDHPRSLGEVGREGVAVDSLEDMETLFGGIPLGEVSTSMTINAPAAIVLAFYVCVGEQQGVAARRAPRHGADGHPQGVHRAEGVHLPARAVAAARDGHDRVVARASCRRCTRSRSPATTSARPARPRRRSSRSRSRTGSRTSSGRSRAGCDVDEFAPRLSFFFNAHLDFFEEIAKYRAARRIWARELRDRFGAKDERSLLMRFHTQTAGVSLTAQQPEVNIVRTAIEALAAVLGGTQSLHTNSFDEALALPSEDAVRIALRTQQVIAHETGVVNTIDPLGGSYYVEHLTIELERQAYDYFERIDALGGVLAGIEQNFFQREIADAAFRYQREVESGQRVVVGVNRYAAGRRDGAAAPCASTRRSSARRSSASRRCGRGATRRRSRRALARLRDGGGAATRT